MLPTLTHSVNAALSLPETAKTTEAAQYTASNLHKINTDLPTKSTTFIDDKVRMSGCARPTRYRLVRERNRCIVVVDSHLSPQLKQNPHIHSCKQYTNFKRRY